MKKTLLIVVIVVALSTVADWYWLGGSGSSAQYRFAKVDRGDLLVTVTATGTVQPVIQVQIGTQVSGTVQKLFADFNSKVKAGELIAQIDPLIYQSLVDQNTANLEKSKADVERVRATLIQAGKDLARSQELANRDLISMSDLDAAVATYHSLIAQIKVAEATVEQSQATLNNSEVNLRYTNIVSPIDGVVISRNVDVGQTVAASLQAPTLFVIANNLKNIQIQATVSEADIGKISEGQSVTFTVDAYKNDKFSGKVFQIRLLPTTVQNVVTYTVIINAENPNEKLLPGMTANALFEVANLKDVLKVPNAALRFNPQVDSKDDAGSKAKHGHNLWVLTQEGLTAINIITGLSDGNWTQIVKGDITEGKEVITGLLQNGEKSSMSSPFVPQYGGGGQRR